MDNGNVVVHATGAWVQTGPGSAVFTDGRCALSKVTSGKIRVRLEFPCSESEFSASVIQNGDPTDGTYGIVHTSDTEKQIWFSNGRDEYDDSDFSFIFFRTRLAVA